VLRSLARLGVAPVMTVSARDHGSFSGRSRRRIARAVEEGMVDLWLASPKCVLHLDGDIPGTHVAVVSREVTLHPLLRKRLREIGSDPRSAAGAP
jgi:hypothetical protein